MRRLVATVTSACAFVMVVHAAGPRVPLGLDRYRPVPATNALTRDKVAIGRRLFFDRRLSRDSTRSCASCHDPGRAFTDGRGLTVGPKGEIGRRNVPTLVNRAWGRTFFWDGRTNTLEEQALMPIINPLELGATPDAALGLARSNEYRRMFLRAFGQEPSFVLVGKALASYVRTITAGASPFDRYLAGQASALTAAARRGRTLFDGQARCSTCHAGTFFSDEEFHNTGVAWRPRVSGTPADPHSDTGRFMVTGLEEDRGAFKTPTLRQVSMTGPYMHDGSMATLADVVAFYNQGGGRNRNLDHRLRPLHLSPEARADLVAFLESLSGPVNEGW
jgi:cytochrome c peroxidase